MGEYQFRAGCGSVASGYNSCMVTAGLFEGVSREERRAQQQADAAELRFRRAKGYRSQSFWAKLARKWHLA